MKRKLMSELIRWRDNTRPRKPLILEGARQVGKTYLLQQFGKHYYDNVVYVNFDRLDSDITELFSGSVSPTRIIDFLSIKYSTPIEPGKTLLIFDEVQELPRALASLKYFAEEVPEHHIVAAGSLLGVALHSGTSFPVGKVDFMRLEPLSFEEFCWANGLENQMDFIRTDILRGVGFADELSDEFRKYLVIGGMPEAVLEWTDTKDMNRVDAILKNILTSYSNDFSKYTDPAQAERIRQVWQSIPSQFAKETHKFVYGVVRSGARAREYELAIGWLVDAGLVRKVHAVSRGDELPLSAYQDIQTFKLYLLDVGLLRVMSGLSSGDLVGADDVFGQFDGLFAEQFVLQQLSAHNLYYWRSGAESEVDFVVQKNGKIIPIEVKSGENVKAKSLRVYRDKYEPELAVRFSMKPLENNQGLLNIPLYYSWLFDQLLESTDIPPKNV